ncbi:MAG: hypothetical protein WA160_03580 [Pseudobdellovibrio sp.]
MKTKYDSNLNINVPDKPVTRLPDISIRNPIQPKINRDIFRRLDIIENDEALATGFQSGSQKRSGLKLSLWTWLSASIDGLVIVSLSCFFAVAFSFLMKTTPTSMFVIYMKSNNPGLNLTSLFLLSTWSYLIFMRAFIGASIGEWSCGLRLGEPLQRLKKNYLFKVMFRTTVIILSGVITIPLISMLISKDIAGELSDVRIYSLQ